MKKEGRNSGFDFLNLKIWEVLVRGWIEIVAIWCKNHTLEKIGADFMLRETAIIVIWLDANFLGMNGDWLLGLCAYKSDANKLVEIAWILASDAFM